MNNFDHNVLSRIPPCCSPRKLTFWLMMAWAAALARTKIWEFERGHHPCKRSLSTVSEHKEKVDRGDGCLQREDLANRP